MLFELATNWGQYIFSTWVKTKLYPAVSIPKIAYNVKGSKEWFKIQLKFQ